MDAKTLRERIAHARQQGRRVDGELQQAAVMFAEGRNAAGISWKAVGVELGMSWHTLMYWRDRQRPSKHARLARVEIVSEEPPPATRKSFVVHTATGLRIESMSVQQVAELIARLR